VSQQDGHKLDVLLPPGEEFADGQIVGFETELSSPVIEAEARMMCSRAARFTRGPVGDKW